MNYSIQPLNRTSNRWNRTRSERNNARELYIQNMIDSGSTRGARNTYWESFNPRYTYTFERPENAEMAWQFVAYITNCIANGRPEDATRRGFILSSNPEQLDNPSYASDFFVSVKDARIVEEAYRNEYGEIVYRPGKNLYPFSQGTLRRSN